MDRMVGKQKRRERRKRRIRANTLGSAAKPRLTVYKSLNHMYAQIIDDLNGKTIVAASTADKGVKLEKTGNSAAAAAVGQRLAEKASSKGISEVFFDRNGFKFHGRVKALADAARKAGLKF